MARSGRSSRGGEVPPPRKKARILAQTPNAPKCCESAPHSRLSYSIQGPQHFFSLPPAPQGESPHERPYFFFAGRLERIKGLDDVIPVFRDYPDADLLVAGDGEHAEHLRTLGEGMPNVRFLGRISDAELKGLLENASAFACPSLTEGFGLMPLEAMALGCPAVIAPCGALPEVCGDAALIADPHSPGDWAAQLAKLRSDEEAAADYSARGKDRARLFSWDHSARALLDVLTESDMKRAIR